jgi:hypothetical protein
VRGAIKTQNRKVVYPSLISDVKVSRALQSVRKGGFIEKEKCPIFTSSRRLLFANDFRTPGRKYLRGHNGMKSLMTEGLK